MKADMTEKGSRPQRPFRFWLPPSWTSRPAAASTRRTSAPSREKSTLPPPSPRPPAEATSARPPASASRRSVTHTQPPSPASSQNRQSPPINKNIKPPSRSQTKTQSASAARAAAKPLSTLTQTGSDEYSQYQSPATKRSPAKPPCTSARNSDKNVQQLTINSLESFPDTSPHASTSEKEAVRINLEKVEPSKLQEDDDKLRLTAVTEEVSMPPDGSRIESRQGNATRDGTKKKEIKIQISPISQDQFIDGKRSIYKEEIREGLSRLVQKIGSRKNSVSTNVITLAGKNSGACMVIGSDGTMYNEEMQSNSNGKTTFSASINNNVQSINNSSIDRSSCSVRNPGVHLEHIRPKETWVCDKSMEPIQAARAARRALIPNQKPTHEPRIRRRCLRALFMESSESDPDNPKKPRRHGCRFSCEEKSKAAKGDNSQASTAITGEQNRESL